MSSLDRFMAARNSAPDKRAFDRTVNNAVNTKILGGPPHPGITYTANAAKKPTKKSKSLWDKLKKN